MLRLTLALSLALVSTAGGAPAQAASPETALPFPERAGVGERCAARSDCDDGLRCYANVCRNADHPVILPRRGAPRQDEPRAPRSVPRLVAGSVVTGLGVIQLTIGAVLLGIAGSNGSSSASCSSFCLPSSSDWDGLGQGVAGAALTANGALMTLIGLPILITGAIREEPPKASAVRIEPTANGLRFTF